MNSNTAGLLRTIPGLGNIKRPAFERGIAMDEWGEDASPNQIGMFEESEHPRDEGGKFTSGSGGGSGESESATIPKFNPDRNYTFSKVNRVINDPGFKDLTKEEQNRWKTKKKELEEKKENDFQEQRKAAEKKEKSEQRKADKKEKAISKAEKERREKTGAMTPEEFEKMRESLSINERMKLFNNVTLHVPYEDKDKAKAMGAKWDANKKTWYWPGLTHNEKANVYEYPQGKEVPEGLKKYLTPSLKKQVVPAKTVNTERAAPKKLEDYSETDQNLIREEMNRINSSEAVKAKYIETPWYETQFKNEFDYMLHNAKNQSSSRQSIGMYR